MRRAAGTTFIAIGAVVALSGCWLQPGFDPGQSGYNFVEQGITPANASHLHIAWTRQLGGRVNAPAVSIDGVYATAGGSPGAGTLTGLDRADGSTRWSASLFGNDSGLDVGAPTLVGNKVYAPSPGVLDLGGSIRTFNAATGSPATSIGQRTSRVVARANVLIGTGTQFCCGQAASSLFVADTAGAGSWFTYLDVVDVGGGGAFPVVTSVAIGADRFFIGRGTAIQAWPVARPASCPPVLGTPVCNPLWSNPTGATAAGHPVVSPDDATVYAAAGPRLVALSAATGLQAWSGTLGATASAAPAIGNGFVYVPTASGKLDVFDANGCGQVICAPLWSANTGSSISQQPAVVAGGLVYSASANGTITAYPAAGCHHPTCTAVWSAATGSAITGGPVPALGNLYVGTADGRLIAYGL
jgi:outer membrane protein assembly factor BamB